MLQTPNFTTDIIIFRLEYENADERLTQFEWFVSESAFLPSMAEDKNDSKKTRLVRIYPFFVIVRPLPKVNLSSYVTGALPGNFKMDKKI